MKMDISKVVWTDPWHYTVRMDFSDLPTMMGLYSKESTVMDSEMDGEDLSLQMEMSLKEDMSSNMELSLSITENQLLKNNLKINLIFYNVSINHFYIFS